MDTYEYKYKKEKLPGFNLPPMVLEGTCNQVRGFDDFPPFNTTEKRYFFFSHHKAGTILSWQVMTMMSVVLGLPCEVVDWGHVANGAGCSSAPLAMYEDTRPEFILKIMEECPNAIAVHLTREAFASVVSNYVYTLNLQPFEEVPQDVAQGQMLQGMSTKDGVKFKCDNDVQAYMFQLGSSTLLRDRLENPNMINIRYEDWTGDYNATSKAIFEHFFGKDNATLVDTLVAGASQFDLNMQSEEEVEDNHHVSDEEEKANATAVMAELYAEGEECTLWIETCDLQMQYDIPEGVLNP
jgi:hypothetical protein